MKTKTLRISSISRSPLWRGSVLIPLVLACFALSPTAWALDPPPDGGYPNFTTAEGEGALFSLTTGYGNTGIGEDALSTTTDGIQNTAVGWNALARNTGGQNVAIGVGALGFNTTGGFNTAIGNFALEDNTTGEGNTAIGFGALEVAVATNNTATGYLALFGFNDGVTGSYNTADGVSTLTFDSTGSYNTANGFQALYSNTTGGSNTANGVSALLSNTTGGFNTANGANTLQLNTIGGFNVADGGFALFSNTTGSNNVAAGGDALFSNTTGSGNIAVGAAAGVNLTTGSNNIDIGNQGVAADLNTIRIGTQGTQVKSFIAGISGTGVSGSAVKINSNGQLGVAPSAKRFKEAIKPMDKASEAILALEPVTFRYKHELDPAGTPQFGLVAEEVEKIDRDLVARDDQGKPYTVRYEAVNAMLLNEFLKEHRKVTDQGNEIAELKATVAELKSAVKEQAAAVRKVNEEIKVSQGNPRLVSIIP